MGHKLTKANGIEIITEKNGYTKKQASDIFEALLEIMKSTLTSGDDILISGFGKLCVRDKAERKGRNPATGEILAFAARRVVTFKCSGKLRDRINGR
jgi:integration host factor subunit alpha